MNILPGILNLAGTLGSAYMMGGMGGSPTGQNLSQAAQNLGGTTQSGILPGIAPNATVPMQTGSGGGMFGGLGQGLTNSSAGLFQPNGGGMLGGPGLSQAQKFAMLQGDFSGLPGMQQGMNPLVMALMNRG